MTQSTTDSVTAGKAAAIIRILSAPGSRDPRFLEAVVGKINRRPVVVTSRKIYLRIPGGELQFGRISRRLTIWFRGRRLV